MALAPGNADCTTGLSLRIYIAWNTEPTKAAMGLSGITPAPTGAALAAQIAGMKAMAYGIAVAVCAEITANGEGVIGVGGLQQYNPGSGVVDTLAPSGVKTITLR